MRTTRYWCGPEEPSVPQATLERLQAFSEKWLNKVGNERQLAQPFLLDLCTALGTEPPYTRAAIADYAFERPVTVPGKSAPYWIDLYKRGCFVLEAKCGRASNQQEGGAPVRGSRGYMGYIQSAYNDQARLYSAHLEHEPPPLLIVVDVGFAFWIWPQENGSYAAFNSPNRVEIGLADVADATNAAILQACFDDPSALDPSRFQEEVSRDIASGLATLASDLEGDHDPNAEIRIGAQGIGTSGGNSGRHAESCERRWRG